MLRATLFLTLLLPTSAWATCFFQCDVKLVNLGCTVQPDGSAVPAAGPVLFAANCQTCCAPPGGNVTCSPTDPNTATWHVLGSNNQPVPGAVSDLQQKCIDGEMMGYAPTGTLPVDSYALVVDSVIVAHFIVAPPAGNCKTSTDCGTCEVCVSGNCMGMGLIECTQDSDCQVGQICHKGAQTCQNQCIAKGGCSSNADCAKCTFCVAGQCEGTGLSMCQTDADCGLSQFCQVGECGNLCVTTPTDAGTQDVAPSDTVQTETVASDTAAPDVAAVDAVADVYLDSGNSDALCVACDAGPDALADSADAGSLDGAATDIGGASSGGGSASSGCAAARTSDGPWAALLAVAAIALVRRRRLA